MFGSMTKKENISVVKLGLYSSLCDILASGFLSVIVYLF